MSTLNFSIGRVEKALTDAARSRKIDATILAQAKISTRCLMEICGDFSQNRKMAIRIGLTLMNGNRTVLIPVCFNYSSLENYQTEVRLFVTKHLSFLEAVCNIISTLEPVFLLPSQEVLNSELCRIVGRSKEEMSEILDDVESIINSLTIKNNWSCRSMTSLIPDISKKEQVVCRVINANKDYEQKIAAHAWQRRMMYLSGSSSMSFEDMKLRTAQTASQYIVLGRFVAENNFLICNHTTTSLRWYMETDAAVLHNPISLR